MTPLLALGLAVLLQAVVATVALWDGRRAALDYAAAGRCRFDVGLVVALSAAFGIGAIGAGWYAVRVRPDLPRRVRPRSELAVPAEPITLPGGALATFRLVRNLHRVPLGPVTP